MLFVNQIKFEKKGKAKIYLLLQKQLVKAQINQVSFELTAFGQSYNDYLWLYAAGQRWKIHVKKRFHWKEPWLYNKSKFCTINNRWAREIERTAAIESLGLWNYQKTIHFYVQAWRQNCFALFGVTQMQFCTCLVLKHFSILQNNSSAYFCFSCIFDFFK